MKHIIIRRAKFKAVWISVDCFPAKLISYYTCILLPKVFQPMLYFAVPIQVNENKKKKFIACIFTMTIGITSKFQPIIKQNVNYINFKFRFNSFYQWNTLNTWCKKDSIGPLKK